MRDWSGPCDTYVTGTPSVTIKVFIDYTINNAGACLYKTRNYSCNFI